VALAAYTASQTRYSKPSRPKAPPPLSALRAFSFSPWGPAEAIEDPRLLLNQGLSEPCYATGWRGPNTLAPKVLKVGIYVDPTGPIGWLRLSTAMTLYLRRGIHHWEHVPWWVWTVGLGEEGDEWGCALRPKDSTELGSRCDWYGHMSRRLMTSRTEVDLPAVCTWSTQHTFNKPFYTTFYYFTSGRPKGKVLPYSRPGWSPELIPVYRHAVSQ